VWAWLKADVSRFNGFDIYFMFMSPERADILVHVFQTSALSKPSIKAKFSCYSHFSKHFSTTINFIDYVYCLLTSEKWVANLDVLIRFKLWNSSNIGNTWNMMALRFTYGCVSKIWFVCIYSFIWTYFQKFISLSVLDILHICVN